jgi:hypothetical protein
MRTVEIAVHITLRKRASHAVQALVCVVRCPCWTRLAIPPLILTVRQPSLIQYSVFYGKLAL